MRCHNNIRRICSNSFFNGFLSTQFFNVSFVFTIKKLNWHTLTLCFFLFLCLEYRFWLSRCIATTCRFADSSNKVISDAFSKFSDAPLLSNHCCVLSWFIPQTNLSWSISVMKYFSYRISFRVFMLFHETN